MPSPMTLPAGVTGTNCLAMFTGKLATLLMPVSRDQLDRVRAAHEQVEHVVGLVEEHGGLLPCLLLPPPVGELRRDHRVDVGAELGVAQQADGVAGLVEEFLQILGGHVHPFSSGVTSAGRWSRPGPGWSAPVLVSGDPVAVGGPRRGATARLVRPPVRAQSRSNARRGRVAPHTAGCRAASGHIGRARIRQMSHQRACVRESTAPPSVDRPDGAGAGARLPRVTGPAPPGPSRGPPRGPSPGAVAGWTDAARRSDAASATTT